MLNQFASDSILYYPTIEFQSEIWVKQALTFWDTIYRIVPTGYIPKDSEEIYIAKQNGFIKDIELSNSDLKKTASQFEDYYEDLKFLPSGYDSSDYEVRLNSSKMDERLKDFFKQYSPTTDHEGFYKLPEKVANGYMFFLADSISKNRNIGRLTDDGDMFAAMIHFDGEGDFDEAFIDYEAEELYSTLIIENLIPSDIRSIKMEIVLNISSSMKNWKNRFRKTVCEFNEKLSKIEDKKFAQQEVENFKKNLLELKLTRKEILSSYFQELASSLLYVGVPASMTGILGSIFSSPEAAFDSGKLVQGTIVGAVAAFASLGKEIRKNWSAERANYYLELSKHLTSGEKSTLKHKNVSKLLDQYIND